MRSLAALALAAVFSATGLAPYQCARDPDPARALEETPGDALYALAERFREQGDERAREATLRFLVERYPSNRFATTAREELARMGTGAATGGGPP